VGGRLSDAASATNHIDACHRPRRGLDAIGAGLLGSVSRGLLHYAGCPVVVIRASEESAACKAPVLLDIDGSPASEAATALAFDEASRRVVRPVAAVGPAGWSEQYPDIDVQRRIVCDSPAQRLIEASAHAQLVVLGCRGRGGFARMLLVSVSTTVAESSKTPVIVVRGSSSQRG
jgi:nucleotide-binding universal stress UspA family protein